VKHLQRPKTKRHLCLICMVVPPTVFAFKDVLITLMANLPYTLVFVMHNIFGFCSLPLCNHPNFLQD
jgi:hypothetical protein